MSINDIRALELYELALSVVDAKGLPHSDSTLKEYRAGNLTIHYSAKTGYLEVLALLEAHFFKSWTPKALTARPAPSGLIIAIG